MQSNNYFLLNSSVIYRAATKFFAKELAEYDMGVTQVMILITVQENEGISMQELAAAGDFDKGTITKAIQKMEEQGYIALKENREDKRGKKLFMTNKSRALIGKLYLKRQQWWELVTKGMTTKEAEDYQRLLTIAADNARSMNRVNEAADIRIFGFRKMTLLDYPDGIGCTVFVGGCNYRCPFCQNSDLVFLKEDMIQIPPEDVLDYLEKRKGLIDGVCISGGEPTLQPGLKAFITKIRDLGYPVKLDTNGSDPELVKELIDEGLVEYVAMDIKNAPSKYSRTTGLQRYDVNKVKQTAQILMTSGIQYEFRTTVVKEFHNAEDFEKIGEWLKGAGHYYLQKFVDAPTVIRHGLTPPTDEELEQYKSILERYIGKVDIR